MRPDTAAIEIAFVNNMPDAALSATLNQFSRLVRRGAAGKVFRLRCYTLPSIARGESARAFLDRTHESIEALYARGADALIVSGAEPKAAHLSDEPYWSDLAQLVDWARINTLSTLWSCLASHAAVLHLDGIERRRRPSKLSGVFAFEAEPGDWVNDGCGARVLSPHSRYNDLPQAELEARGYIVASASETSGVNVFWRREPSLFVFLQGHPEYDRDTLAREYRRDMTRFLGGEMPERPAPPENYFAEEFETQFRRALAAEPAAGRGVSVIPTGEQAPEMTWAADATRLYRNWIEATAREKRRWRISA